MNPFKQLGQNRKATSLANLIARCGYRSADAAKMSDFDWDLASMAAKVNAPSIETRALVVQMLAQREVAA
jgi:hypothetical protein